jgi:hypothetical protein
MALRPPRFGPDPWRHAPWAAWYETAAWKRRRDYQLRIEPLCRMCNARGVVTPASVADHVTPHHGDYNAFRLGQLQSLCGSCHRGPKREQELHGFASGCDAQGNPLDPEHPWNQTHQALATALDTTTSSRVGSKVRAQHSMATHHPITQAKKALRR